MYQRIIWTAENLDVSEGIPLHDVKKKATSMRDCQKYLRKLKIEEVSFQDLKIVNFENFTLVFFAFIYVCCMDYIVHVLK